MTTPEPKKEKKIKLEKFVKDWRVKFVKTFFVYKLGDKFPDHVGAEKEAVSFIKETIREEKLRLLDRIEQKYRYSLSMSIIQDIREEIKKGEL